MTGLRSLLGLQEVEAPRISRQSEHKVGKVAIRKHWPPLPRTKYPLYSFVLDAESNPVTVRPERLSQ